MRTALLLATSALLAAPALAQKIDVKAERGPAAIYQGGSNNPTATATSGLFGNSCGTRCGSLNVTGTQRTGTLPNEYSYAFKASKDATIIGVAYHTNATNAAGNDVSLTCGYYTESTTAGTPNAAPMTTGTMIVQKQFGWYIAVFAKPQAVKSGATIWVSQYNTSAALASAKTAGTAPPARTFWRRPPGQATSTWRPTGIIRFPAYRIICSDDLLHTASAPPKLGTTIKLTLQGLGSAGAGVTAVGATRANLPLFCGRLYTTPALTLNFAVAANGTGSLNLPIPNNMSLDGKSLIGQQAAIGAKGLVLTNANKLTFGN